MTPMFSPSIIMPDPAGFTRGQMVLESKSDDVETNGGQIYKHFIDG